MSAEMIRRVLVARSASKREVDLAWDALERLLAENERLREALRISYPMTPVDCFLSDLDELTLLTSSLETVRALKAWLRDRKAQLNAELAGERGDE